MNLIKRVGSSLKGFGQAIAAIPKDIKRYRTMKKM
jgi:hypothetical protein